MVKLSVEKKPALQRSAPHRRSHMTSQARDTLTFDLVRILYINGQATAQMFDAGKRLGDALGLKITIIARWGELQLRIGGSQTFASTNYPPIRQACT